LFSTVAVAAYSLDHLGSVVLHKREQCVAVRFYRLDVLSSELVEVSMLLGHSELRVTADLYSHLQQQTASRAAKHMESVLQLAKDA